MGRAHTYGLELSVDWRPTDSWRLRGGYSWYRAHFWARRGSTDPAPDFNEKIDPGNYWYLQSSHDLHANVTLDWTLRHVGDSPSLNVKSYETLDVRLGWKPRPGLELALVGRNLNDPSHMESGSVTTQPQLALPVVRDVFATVKWEF